MAKDEGGFVSLETEETPVEEEPKEEPSEEPTEPEEESEEEPEEESVAPEDEVSEEKPSQEDSQKDSQEYTKERFDGLMSARQAEKRRADGLETELQKATKPAEKKSNEDVWLDFIEGKLRERQVKRETTEDDAAYKELNEVKTAYPDLNPDEVLDAGIKYKSNLMTAAGILEDIKSGQRSGRTLTETETAKKKSAGKIAAKPGAVLPKGLTPYDSKLSRDENIERGIKELGLE